MHAGVKRLHASCDTPSGSPPGAWRQGPQDRHILTSLLKAHVEQIPRRGWEERRPLPKAKRPSCRIEHATVHPWANPRQQRPCKHSISEWVGGHYVLSACCVLCPPSLRPLLLCVRHRIQPTGARRAKLAKQGKSGRLFLYSFTGSAIGATTTPSCDACALSALRSLRPLGLAILVGLVWPARYRGSDSLWQ